MHWQLTNDLAIASIGSSRIAVVANDPSQFAQIQLEAGISCSWEAFKIKPLPTHAMVPEEIYIRENDLIAHFRQSESDLYAFQLDWQLLFLSPQFEAGIELWLSIQTDFLDTEPELEVACRAPQDQQWQFYDHASLVKTGAIKTSDRLRVDGSWSPAAMCCRAGEESCLWLIEPSDQHQTRLVSPAEDSLVRTRLFGDFMEKGVIRRARMRFLVATGELTADDLLDAYRAFALSPLPLTA